MNPFFDSIIILFLVASDILCINIWRDRKRQGTWESRHSRLTLFVAVLLCCGATLVFWGSFIEPRIITVNRVSIDLPNFEPKKLVRVALISDVHVGTYKQDGWIRRVSKRIISEKPDIVLIAGDLIVDKPEHAKYLSPFSVLRSAFPVYAVLGDHDYQVKQKPQFKIDEGLAGIVAKALTDAGVKVMRNETQHLELHGAPLLLIGLDDWLSKKTDMPAALNKLPNYLITELPVVVLVHNPDFILDPEFTAKAGQAKNIDLILAGNTHGGQIRLPFIGSLARLPSDLPKSFDKGLFELHYTDHAPPTGQKTILSTSKYPRLFITSGISESGPRARLFNPPEIVLLELR